MVVVGVLSVRKSGGMTTISLESACHTGRSCCTKRCTKWFPKITNVLLSKVLKKLCICIFSSITSRIMFCERWRHWDADLHSNVPVGWIGETFHACFVQHESESIHTSQALLVGLHWLAVRYVFKFLLSISQVTEGLCFQSCLSVILSGEGSNLWQLLRMHGPHHTAPPPPPPPDMFKLWTRYTCSNLFIMKFVRTASGPLASYWNAFFL